MCRLRATAALVFAVALVALVAAAAVSTPPAPTRWVTDRAGLLSPNTRLALDRRLEAYQRRTGRQVIVWIGTTIGNEALEPWAARTFQAWGIGRKGKDDGAAIFILAQDRLVRIEVGYGLEGQLTDLTAARIIREQMTPRLQRGNADGAVVAGVNGVLAAVGGEDPASAPSVQEPQPVRSVSKGDLVIFGIGVLLFLVLLVTNPSLASALLFTMASGGSRRGHFHWGGGGSSGGGGFSGGGGRSGGGGASGSW